MCLSPLIIQNRYVSCGKCVECLQKKSREWAFRIFDEAKAHKDTCFITLTYNDDNLPLGSTLVKRDLQLFMKRLRKFCSPKTIRFFACGEYGKKYGRPHYHIIIFGYTFSDLYYFFKDKKSGDILYRSPSLEKLWTFGFSTVGKLTFDTAKYCAKYMQKTASLYRKEGKIPPFLQMSRRPFIGRYGVDVKSLETDKIYQNGSYISIPRTYLNYFEKSGFSKEVEELKKNRLAKCKFDSVESEYNYLLGIQKRFERARSFFGYKIDDKGVLGGYTFYKNKVKRDFSEVPNDIMTDFQLQVDLEIFKNHKISIDRIEDILYNDYSF